MTREEFANFLKQLKTANDSGQDIDAIVKEHEHRNVYFYNDGCIKKILASEKNLMLTTDLINAALNLVGSDRIENPQLVNPFIPGELGYRSVEPDLLLTNDRGTGVPRDRISPACPATAFPSMSSTRTTIRCTATVWFSTWRALRAAWKSRAISPRSRTSTW